MVYRNIFDYMKFSNGLLLEKSVTLLTLLFVISMITIFIKVRKKKTGLRSYVTIVVCMFFFTAELFSFIQIYKTRKNFTIIFEKKLYSISIGKVDVLQKQKLRGPIHSDIVSINGKQFEIIYSENSVAYNKTIVRGGVLKEGSFVRIYYYDGNILRIDRKIQ